MVLEMEPLPDCMPWTPGGAVGTAGGFHTPLIKTEPSVPFQSTPENIGLGCHALLQGIFPTQGSNPSLPHCRRILYRLSHQGSPRILGWVAYPFSRVSSHPRTEPGFPAMLADAELSGSSYVYSMHNIIYIFHETYEFLHSQKLYFASILLT